MSEMVERVLDQALALGFQATERDIRLLLAELREPTEAMAEAGEGAQDDPRCVWRVMMGAALAE